VSRRSKVQRAVGEPIDSDDEDETECSALELYSRDKAHFAFGVGLRCNGQNTTELPGETRGKIPHGEATGMTLAPTYLELVPVPQAVHSLEFLPSHTDFLPSHTDNFAAALRRSILSND
jgi:hypothetical protein